MLKPTMFRLTSLIPPSPRSNVWAPWPFASPWSGIAAFSSTRHVNTTRAAREHESEEARAAEAQRREYRKQYNFEYKRNPDNQAKQAEHNRRHHLKNRTKNILYLRQLRAEDLRLRRANTLASFIRLSKRWAQEKWSWPTHQVLLTAARVDRHCTSCNQIRRLKLWWKEKQSPQGLETESPQDRYMCNSCFANSWELVVPEGAIENLPPLFTSPDHPPPKKT